MEEFQKEDLVLKLIDGFLNETERKQVDKLLLQDEELRLFYEANLFVHQELANEPLIKTPDALKTRLKQNLAPVSYAASLGMFRVKSFKKTLLLNILVLSAIFILVISATIHNRNLGEVFVFTIPFDYVLNIALVSGSIAILTYADKWLSLKSIK